MGDLTHERVLQSDIASSWQVQQLINDLTVWTFIGVYSGHRQQCCARLSSFQNLFCEVGDSEGPESRGVVVDVQYVDR